MAIHGFDDLSQSLRVKNAQPVVPTTRSLESGARPELVDRTTQVQVSRAGELLEKLGQLQSDRPGDFRGIMLELAKETQSEIASGGGGASIRTLRQLMERINKAMDEGSLRALTPELARGQAARNPYKLQQEDALLSPSEELQGLLGRFLDKVSAVLPAAEAKNATTAEQ